MAKYAAKSKQSPYDGGVRTPILVRWPGKVAPGEPLGSIPGVVPRIPPGFQGCGFRDRCGMAMSECATVVPRQMAAAGHEYLCRLPTGWTGLKGAA